MKTKNSILTPTKLFFILFFSVFLFSCGRNLPTGKIKEKPYIVKSITDANIYSEGTCRYVLTTGVDYYYFRDNIEVVDSIGKFVIGDSVSIYLIKR
jgi:hypothetical protein